MRCGAQRLLQHRDLAADLRPARRARGPGPRRRHHEPRPAHRTGWRPSTRLARPTALATSPAIALGTEPRAGRKARPSGRAGNRWSCRCRLISPPPGRPAGEEAQRLVALGRGLPRRFQPLLHAGDHRLHAPRRRASADRPAAGPALGPRPGRTPAPRRALGRGRAGPCRCVSRVPRPSDHSAARRRGTRPPARAARLPPDARTVLRFRPSFCPAQRPRGRDGRCSGGNPDAQTDIAATAVTLAALLP